ncbi:MAG TPA: methyltransferase domain-containing protein [Frateuria sp.]|uniref:class I SAM-dependent methyltransferase n=1 Tax=Frateuria sp. TaxID=2211372 RepID=UPI002D7F3A03|nr:methyltransferase domain-containing protein [Frateuria sp.]HET6806368.1 methyltransferase domain-containing protein [Frateuria sp.]
MRTQFVRSRIDRESRGLEIGPSHSPLAPKQDGYHVDVVDHLDAAGLREKYRGHGVDLNRIEPVDVVWQGGSLAKAVGKPGCYRWIIASHVIEHIPDVVRFLQDCEGLLDPSGVLLLVVPDKRRCFDHFQSITSTGALLDAYHARSEKPSPGRVFDHFANAVSRGRTESLAWSSFRGGRFRLKHDFADAHHAWVQAQGTDRYIDVHNWRFTPASFQLLINDLRQLGLIRLAITSRSVGPGEFYAALSVDATVEQPNDRIESLRRISEGQ